MQDKIVTPTTEEQKIKADSGIYGLNEITIEPVTNEIDENIKSENIKSGIYILGIEGNVVELVGEEITIQPKSYEQEIVPTAPKNGFTKVIVNAQSGVDINDYFETTITNSNSTYFGRDRFIKKLPSVIVQSGVTSLNNLFSGCDYIKEININGDTSKVTNLYQMFFDCHFLVNAPYFDTSSAKNMSHMFSNCNRLETVPLFNTSNVTNLANTFSSCSKLKTIPAFNTSNITTFNYLFSYCASLESVPKLNADKIIQTSGMFAGTKDYFTDFGGLENLGMAYLTNSSANHYNYKLDLSMCSKLTEQSLINVLLNLYDIATKGCKTQTVQLGPTNLAKLTSEAGQQALAQATAYGWTVS